MIFLITGVPIATLLTFNRLKVSCQPLSDFLIILTFVLLSCQALSSDPDCITRALRKSTANILEVNVEGTAVRRSPENPPPDIFSPEQRQKMKEKTVYVVSECDQYV